jgi:serine/threonine-protein kinase HipA
LQTVVNITLWEQNVAALAWDKIREIGVLEFYESFPRTEWNIAPLMMPMEDIFRGERIFSFPNLKSKTFKGLPGLIADALPDDYGNSVIDEWFSARGKNVELTPLDRLCYIGKRGMGALEFKPANDEALLNESSKIEIQELVSLAQQMLDRRSSFSTTLDLHNDPLIDILRVGTSAGGAKPKAIIAFNEKTKEVRSGQVKAPEGFSYWIIKFDGMEGGDIKDNPLGIGRIEYTYYHMALDCGIKMMPSRLLEDGIQSHFMTQRFDRTDNGDKIMMQTLCGIAHYDRDDRYGYEQLFSVMRRIKLDYPDFEQQYRRMVFNIIARNHDDHTKNHSFIMDKEGTWKLAPAYDLCYTYSPAGQWTSKHQMSVNGKRDNFSLHDLVKIGEENGIHNPKYIIENIVSTVSEWSTYATSNDVNSTYIKQIGDHLRINLS